MIGLLIPCLLSSTTNAHGWMYRIMNIDDLTLRTAESMCCVLAPTMIKSQQAPYERENCHEKCVQ